jgi:gluconolactonase
VFINDFAPNNQVRPDYENVEYDGRVYRIDTADGKVTKVDSGMKFINGIAFGPDRTLYINDTLTGNVYRYAWRNEEIAAPRMLFGNVIRPDAPAGWKGPDGMAFGTDRKLYVAVFGQRDVTILASDGTVAGRLPTRGAMPTNVAFALPGSKRIHVTEYEFGQIEAFDVPTDGLPLWSGGKAGTTAIG